MSKPELIEKTAMNVVEVKAALEKIKAKETELNFRAAKADEYAQDFARISLKDARELLEKLKGLDIPRLKDNHFNKLIDIMPTSEKQVKIVLSSMNMTPTAEQCKKLADTLTEYAPRRH